MSNLLATLAIALGSSFPVPSWQWVDVLNTAPVSNVNITYSYGDRCGIEPGGSVAVLDSDEDRILVRYYSDVAKAGTSCPNDAIFWVEKRDLVTWKARDRKRASAEAKERKYVAQFEVAR